MRWNGLMVLPLMVGCGQTAPLEFTCHDLARDGGVVPTEAGAEGDAGADASVCTPEPFDACDAEGDTTNQLDGTCFWEQCRDGEKSLFRKPAGVPCVFRPGGGTEWAVGACASDGVCSNGIIADPK